jgi:hypothetical protein
MYPALWFISEYRPTKYGGPVWTLFVPCILFEFNCSSVTPKNAPFIYTNKVLYRSYVFRRHLRLPQGALHQDLKLSKI